MPHIDHLHERQKDGQFSMKQTASLSATHAEKPRRGRLAPHRASEIFTVTWKPQHFLMDPAVEGAQPEKCHRPTALGAAPQPWGRIRVRSAAAGHHPARP